MPEMKPLITVIVGVLIAKALIQGIAFLSSGASRTT